MPKYNDESEYLGSTGAAEAPKSKAPVLPTEYGKF